jgi:DNA invertase Pin-like site-specific DNA recombinase
MLEDALRPGSDVAVIVVHHSSRFTRDAMEARVVKTKLRRAGVRVCSVSQDLPDDPMGKLMEGFFECIDQYESELNGVRTSAAMAEAVRQGYFPGSRPPYGFRSRAQTVREGVVRHLLEPDESEAEVVREIFRLYITRGGAKAVARALIVSEWLRGGTCVLISRAPRAPLTLRWMHALPSNGRRVLRMRRHRLQARTDRDAR